MSYKALYDYCQELYQPSPLQDIVDHAIKFSGADGIKVFPADLDAKKSIGYFIAATNAEHPFVKWAGGMPVIVVSRGNNYCWKRFVIVKEAMHLFDKQIENLNSSAELMSLVAEFLAASPQPSVHLKSENRAFWMGLALFCPEKYRVELNRKRVAGELTDNQIARQLEMPETYVPHLFSPNYRKIIQNILENPA